MLYWLDTRRLAVIILLVSLFAMAARTPADTDTWWHLQAGRVTLENDRILQSDVFSYTRQGQPWINHTQHDQDVDALSGCWECRRATGFFGNRVRRIFTHCIHSLSSDYCGRLTRKAQAFPSCWRCIVHPQFGKTPYTTWCGSSRHCA